MHPLKDSIHWTELSPQLLPLAALLNSLGPAWGIGGSLVLLYHGLVHAVRDIDILVGEEDAEAFASLLSLHAKPLPISQSTVCISKGFYRYDFQGCEVDLIAGFTLHHTKGSYSFPFDSNSVVAIEIVEGVTLPFTSLEDWWLAYRLMPGREAKAADIYQRLFEGGVMYPMLLRRALEQQLPEPLHSDILGLLNRT